MNGRTPLLQVANLSLSYRQGDGWLRVLKSVTFDIGAGETFGLAGESGCGKSTIIHQILGYAPPNSRLDHGQVIFNGADILKMKSTVLSRLWGCMAGLVLRLQPGYSLLPPLGFAGIRRSSPGSQSGHGLRGSEPAEFRALRCTAPNF